MPRGVQKLENWGAHGAREPRTWLLRVLEELNEINGVRHSGSLFHALGCREMHESV